MYLCATIIAMTNFDNLNFSTFIEEVVKKYAHRPALGFVDDEPITYAQMGKQIMAVRTFMEALSIKSGDRVVIYSQNMPNWGITYLALQCMGAVVVPVLPDFNAHELQNVLEHSEAKAIFISKSQQHKFAQVKRAEVKVVVQIEDFEVLEGDKLEVKYNEHAVCTSSFRPAANELAVLLYTSGTTGNSKGVMLSQKNILSNVIQSSKVQDIDENDRFLSVLPLSHTYENTIGFLLPLMQGSSIRYLRKPPTASVLLPALKKIQPTMMLTVPMIIEKVYRNSILPKIESKKATRFLHSFKLGRQLVYRLAGKQLYATFGGHLKFFGIGGAKLDAQVEKFLRAARFPYAIGYGLTETSPLLAGSNPKETKLQAIGAKVFNCEVKINNPDPKTGEGEIWAKGPNVMLGYYKNQEGTDAVMTKDGWFKTGDLGVFDKKGVLSHKGRLKNLIVGANGENIYPEEIESLINNFRHVLESLVVNKKGKLVAMVHFNREELELKVQEMALELGHKVDMKLGEASRKVDALIDELANELQQYVNARVNKFSRIQLLVVQTDPFQKTATQKIKRYLYS